MIIDVSCDRNGGIETSVPTTIDNPTYIVDGLMHYVVDHTPAIFYKTFTFNNSRIIVPYVNQLMSGQIGAALRGALITDLGVIIDDEIIRIQNSDT